MVCFFEHNILIGVFIEEENNVYSFRSPNTVVFSCVGNNTNDSEKQNIKMIDDSLTPCYGRHIVNELLCLSGTFFGTKAM